MDLVAKDIERLKRYTQNHPIEGVVLLNTIDFDRLPKCIGLFHLAKVDGSRAIDINVFEGFSESQSVLFMPFCAESYGRLSTTDLRKMLDRYALCLGDWTVGVDDSEYGPAIVAYTKKDYCAGSVMRNMLEVLYLISEDLLNNGVVDTMQTAA